MVDRFVQHNHSDDELEYNDAFTADHLIARHDCAPELISEVLARGDAKTAHLNRHLDIKERLRQEKEASGPQQMPPDYRSLGPTQVFERGDLITIAGPDNEPVTAVVTAVSAFGKILTYEIQKDDKTIHGFVHPDAEERAIKERPVLTNAGKELFKQAAAGAEWLKKHRAERTNGRMRVDSTRSDPANGVRRDRPASEWDDTGANRHSMNDGTHVSPFDNGTILVGNDRLIVNLVQGISEPALRAALARTTHATTGISPDAPVSEEEGEDMFRGGLQSALETQSVVFEVFGASRALTHQLVRTRNAAFHQQSQRATWYGDAPDIRIPENVWRNPTLRGYWMEAVRASWKAYSAACDSDVAYEHARYILPEGTVNYIVCTYTLREFINVYAYRGCSMFLKEMVYCMREMRNALVSQSPFLEPYIKISCEKTPAGKVSVPDSKHPGFTIDEETEHRCTFMGWENVEGRCSFPWAKQSNRTFLPSPKLRIGAMTSDSRSNDATTASNGRV